MKKWWIVVLIAFIIAVLYIYLKNDGIYVLSNINNTELDWINKYAIYDIEFPNETIVEEFIRERDIESFLFSHNECIEATLLVPNEAVEKIIPEFAREYDLDCSLDLRHDEKNKDQIQYNVFMPRTVVKWFDKTQRSIHYTVMKPGDEYTQIYVFVDKLGWNLYKYSKPINN